MVLVPAAKLGRRESYLPSEDSREQILVTETGGPADHRDRIVGLHEQPFRILDADATDFRGGSSADQPHKALLQGPASHGQLADQVGDAQPFVRVIAYQAQRVADHLVVDR
jgi:hypothetical protein